MLQAALDAIQGGWCLTPLVRDTKRPVLKGWTSLPRPTEADVRGWIAQGYLLGIRTGPPSGIVVLDLDPGSEWTPDMFPDAPCVKTPRGHHLYFAAPEGVCPRNSTGKLAPHVDVRGAGGQVVMPGQAGREWIRRGTPPPWPFPVEPKPARKAAAARTQATLPGKSKWADAALLRELEALQAAPEGTRNNALNTAAFNLGQLVGGGELEEGLVVDNLTTIALNIGLDIREVTGTLRSGLEAGKAKPRHRPPPPEPIEIHEDAEEPAQAVPAQAQVSAPAPAPVKPKPRIPIPGEHAAREAGGHPDTMPAHVFASKVLRSIEPGVLYVRMGVVGRVQDVRFEALSPNEMRLIVDQYAQLYERPVPAGNGAPRDKYVSCTVDLATLVLAAARTSKRVRKLEILAPHPLVTPDFEVLEKGWHEKYGALIDYPYDLATVEPIPLWDAVSDFPMSLASQASLLSLALAPLFRPLLEGNMPIHIVTASIERAGKTMLVGDVLGPIWGYDIGMTTWAEDEDEMRKQIIAQMVEGMPIMCIDNVPAVFDSHNIASFVTARYVDGRMLGQSRMVRARNRICLIATGNNTEASGEVAKRSNVVRLDPPDDAPEKRTGFRYPNLLAAVRQRAPNYMRWLIDLIRHGPRATCPPMGGFQPYTVTIGAIVCGQGLPLLNGEGGVAVREIEDMASLFASWKAVNGSEWLTVSEALGAAERIEWGGIHLDPTKSERTRSSWLGRRLAACVGRFAAGGRLERRTYEGRTQYRIA